MRVSDYTFEEFWKEMYGEEISIWNSSLEMYNKAKEEYRKMMIKEGEREQAKRSFYED